MKNMLITFGLVMLTGKLLFFVGLSNICYTIKQEII